MVSAKNLEVALKDSEARKLPLVVAFGMPDTKIENDVRKLTGEKGRIVFLALGKDHPDARRFQRRYGRSAEGFILADEFGNLLKSDLAASSDVVEAVNSLDELTAELFARWAAAIKQAKPLMEQKRFPEAAKVLQVFAFAFGIEKAREGKRLYDEVAAQANQEYQALTRDLPAGNLSRDWATKLSEFARKWPRTPAAFAAEDRLRELGK